MERPKKVNERQIKHLLKALKESGYYFRSLEKKKFEIDTHFLEGLQIFLLDSKGKNVRRVVNAFRVVGHSFSNIHNTDFIDNRISQSVEDFLKKNLTPKKFKKAKEVLNSGKKAEEIRMFPAKVYQHPQKISPKNAGFYFEEEEQHEFGVDFSLKLF